VVNEPLRIRIGASGPVLIPDTSALLDLVRVTDRAQSVDDVAGILQPAVDILRRAEGSPPSVAVVVPQYVHEEYERNIQKVLDTVASRWVQVVQRLAIAHGAAETLRVESRPPTHGINAFEPTLEACDRLADGIRRVGATLDNDDECLLRAAARNLRRDPPSLRGDQFADCTIIEHAMEYARHASSTGRLVVFLSSNKRDYYPDGPVAEPLTTQMQTAGLLFARIWAEAAYRLGPLRQ